MYFQNANTQQLRFENMANYEIEQTRLAAAVPESDRMPGPWPWYIFLFMGFSVSGFFPWLMVGWARYRRGRKAAAGLILAANIAILAGSGWLWLTVPMVWWRLSILAYAFNLLWTAAAFIYQRSTVGAAGRRYYLKQWQSWIRPIAIGLLVGFCIGTIFSIIPAFENRIPMQQSLDSLDRQTVLWDFFRYSPFGMLGGLLIGLWWAGEGTRFKASHIITFLGGFILSILCWFMLWSLLELLIHQGTVKEFFLPDHATWALIPPWRAGLQKFLCAWDDYNILPLVIIPLLLGAPARLRDFGKRALLIPLLFVCCIPLGFTSDSWWSTIQDQITYEMNAADTETRASAFWWADILLARYPNHLQWPRLAEKAAQFHYQNRHYAQSRRIYQSISDRYPNAGQWHWITQRARGALNSPAFGNPTASSQLKLPMVDYQPYLTQNWMSLLSVMRYWEGPEVSESKVVIRLKDLSKSTDKIQLNPLVNLAELDDAARSLGYETLLFHSAKERIAALIDAGIPVIHQHFNSFDIIFGSDESRSAICAYSFAGLSRRLRNEKHKEAEEILDIAQEGQGEGGKRLERIAHESYMEYGNAYWQNPALGYMGPLSAIVFPADRTGTVSEALNMPYNELRKQSDGYLAALIALSYLDHGDPMQSIEWAKIGAAKIDDPLPKYIAHLARVWWESRNKIIDSSLKLERQFPELDQIFKFFNLPQNVKFLQEARDSFSRGFAGNSLPWMISQRYLPLMDRSETAERSRILKLLKASTRNDPAGASEWILLADTCEWSGDASGTIKALEGAVSADPLDASVKLRLATAYVACKRYEQAEHILSQIDPGQVRYDADYPFCLGALAEWQGNADKALRLYAAAIEMRRYKPIYHLRYGELLMAQGFADKAKPYLEWAVRTDAESKFKNEAAERLAQMAQ
jgi:tetratricopeptide (TPR) repeat protein